LKDEKAFELLTDIASDIPKVSNVQISAMLVIKNDIISIGSAVLKSHPFQKRFGKTSHNIFLHAETNCIHRSLRKVDVDELEKATLYICRVKHNFNKENKQNVFGWGIAKPCIGCLRAIVEFNIKRVVYTLDGEHLSWQDLEI